MSSWQILAHVYRCTGIFFLPNWVSERDWLIHPPFPSLLELQAQDRGVRLNSIPQSSGFQTTLQNSQSFLGLFKDSSVSEAFTTKQRKCKLPSSASLLVIFFNIRVLYKISFEKCLNITALDLLHIPLAFLPAPRHFSLIAKREKVLLSLKESWASTASHYELCFLTQKLEDGCPAAGGSSIRLDIWASDFLNLDWLVTSILHPCSYLENHPSTMQKEKTSETKTIVLSITRGSRDLGGRDTQFQSWGSPHSGKSAPFFKVHLPDGDIIEGTLCKEKSTRLLRVYWGKGRLQLERKASQDRHFANELEAPKPKGGDGKKCIPIWGRERNPAPHHGKNTQEFPSLFTLNPKKHSFDCACL